jgi:hypothetical protein
MEFPKKISKRYSHNDAPDIIIRASGNPPSLKYAEYVLTKNHGSMFFYKRR